jgi:hypothetical protein
MTGDEDATDPAAGGNGATTPDVVRPRHRHRGRWIAVGVVVTLLLGYGTFVVVRWVRGTAKPVELSDVDVPTGSTLAAEPAVLRPPQGVYLYEGGGTDRLDKPPKEQAQGPSMPGTVTHEANGCWTFRIDYSTNHWQLWEYCPVDGGLDEAGGSSFQRWNFGALINETTSTFACDSPTVRADQQPGDEWTQSCTGTSSGVDGVTLSSGPYRYVGTETLTIGGESVRAHRYHRERTTSGNQVGSESTEAWFSAETGMPLRNERHLEATSDTVIGEVNYTEDGEFELTSLEPKR